MRWVDSPLIQPSGFAGALETQAVLRIILGDRTRPNRTLSGDERPT
jgi:hypothetical protein